MSIASQNPYTGRLEKTFEAASPEEIETKIQHAFSAYESVMLKVVETQKARTGKLTRAGELLLERKQELAEMMVREMGKTLKSATSEIEKCAANCRFYAETGLKGLVPENVDIPKTSNGKSLRAEVRYLPIGVVLAIMPWNFPFWQVFRCIAPIMLSGNSMILKHASNVPQCALAIEALMKDAGFDQGEFATVLVGSDRIPHMLADPRIRAVTLTGSEGAGGDVASRAGKLIKKSVMELGGSDPFIVMPSAILNEAVETAVMARLICNGQSCIAAKRFLIHDSIYEAFQSKFVEKMKAVKMGDPMKEDTLLGPLVSKKACEDLHALVMDAKEKGARVLCGGEPLPGEAAFYPATVVENIPEDAKLRQEEAFGPLAALYRVRNLDEAIQLANSTRFGLGASFWSSDAAEIEQAVERIESGSVFVNTLVASDPHLPFGGVKASGFGRELGLPGLHEFTNVKTVAILA